MRELPIACSLDRAALAVRIDAIRAIGRDSLVGIERDGHVRRLQFRPGSDTVERLDQIRRAEQECCSFLDLRVETTGDEVVLTIAAPDDATLVADELASAFGESLAR